MADTIGTTTLEEQAAMAGAGPDPQGEAAAPPVSAPPVAVPLLAAGTQADAESAAPPPVDYSGLSLPEGYAADDPVFADAMKLFGAERIAPEVAQKLIDFTVGRDREIARAVNDSAAANWTRQTGEWRTESEKAFTAEQLGDARTALARVFDKETVTYLESMGFTNHPGLIRGMVKVSKAIRDDTFVAGNAGRGNGALDPRSFYPNSQHN